MCSFQSSLLIFFIIQFKNAMLGMGLYLDDEQFGELMSEFDATQKGRVGFKEFCDIMRKTG